MKKLNMLCLATMALDVASTTNQYYWEITVNSGEMAIGIAPITLQGTDTSRPGSYSYYGNPGSKFTGTSSSSYGEDFGAGDVIGVVVGSGKITFYKNNYLKQIIFVILDFLQMQLERFQMLVDLILL